MQIGGSGGKVYYGGAEYVVGQTYQGINVQGGFGAGFEMHGIVETAGVLVFRRQMPWGEENNEPNLPIETHAGPSTELQRVEEKYGGTLEQLPDGTWHILI